MLGLVRNFYPSKCIYVSFIRLFRLRNKNLSLHLPSQMMVLFVITWSDLVIPWHFSTTKTAGKYISSTFKQTRTPFSTFLKIASRKAIQTITTNLRKATLSQTVSLHAAIFISFQCPTVPRNLKIWVACVKPLLCTGHGIFWFPRSKSLVIWVSLGFPQEKKNQAKKPCYSDYFLQAASVSRCSRVRGHRPKPRVWYPIRL